MIAAKQRENISRVCLFLAFAFVFGLVLNISSMRPACAATIADTPCDSLYYETLSARAWLEAQREITQNQNFILKPDSVMQYSCFNLFLNELADHAQNMFSETSAYGAPLGTNSMDDALRQLVWDSLNVYINNNFNYGTPAHLLSGHPSGAALTPAGIAGLNGSGAAPYNCDMMRRVWLSAKCINFITNPAHDGFYTFQEYASNPLDHRYLPTTCSAITANYATNLTVALTSGPWTNDPVQTYLARTTPPATCTGSCACTDGVSTSAMSTAIPTGVTITRPVAGTTPLTYQEHVCLQPGCRYHPGGTLVPLYGNTNENNPGCYGR